MALEYHTLNFTNDAPGIAQKNQCAAQMTSEGWHISTETIEPGHIKGEEACCGFVICAPLAFLAGRTPGYIVTTFAREYLPCTQCGTRLPTDAVFCRNCGSTLSGSSPTSDQRVCSKCGAHVQVGTKFCPRCGNQLLPTSSNEPSSSPESS